MSPPKKYLIILFAVAVLNALLVFSLFGWQRDQDTHSYEQTINYLQGNQEFTQTVAKRMIKPFAMYFAAVFEPVFGAKKALTVTNIIFYFGAIFLLFKIARYIFEDQRKAFFCAVFFMTAYSVIRWGLAALTDMSGWFFFLLSVYLSLLFLEEHRGYQRNNTEINIRKNQPDQNISESLSNLQKSADINGITQKPGQIVPGSSVNIGSNRSKNNISDPPFGIRVNPSTLVWLNGLICGVGLLFKEPGAMGALFFFSIIMLFQFSRRERIVNLLKFGTAFVIVVLPVSLFIYYQYGYSFYHWFVFNEEIRIHYTLKQSIIYSAENIFALMFLAWPFVLIGAYKEYKEENVQRFKILAAFVLPSLSFLIWPFRLVRMMFIAGPLLCLLAASGADFKNEKAQKISYAGIAIAIAFNFLFPKFVDLKQFQDLLDKIF